MPSPPAGFEAGGHRGSFLRPAEEAPTGTMSLVPRVVDTVDVPVIAAGGIGDARGIVAALALGAEAVQMGTAFLACEVSGASRLHREALRGPDAGHTGLTRGFTGRLARGIHNRLMEDLNHVGHARSCRIHCSGGSSKTSRRPAEAAARPDLLPLWAGQSATLSTLQRRVELPRLAGRGGVRHRRAGHAMERRPPEEWRHREGIAGSIPRRASRMARSCSRRAADGAAGFLAGLREAGSIRPRARFLSDGIRRVGGPPSHPSAESDLADTGRASARAPHLSEQLRRLPRRRVRDQRLGRPVLPPGAAVGRHPPRKPDWQLFWIVKNGVRHTGMGGGTTSFPTSEFGGR